MIVRISKKALIEMVGLCEATGLNFVDIGMTDIRLVENKSSINGHYFSAFNNEEITIDRKPSMLITLS